MFITIRLFIASLALCSWLHSSGLPLNEDKSHLLGNVVILKLNKTQQIEISQTRMLTLTEGQLNRLKKVAPGCPKRLGILTNRYDDCSCGMESFAVWFRSGEVEVSIDNLPQKRRTRKEREEDGISDFNAEPIVIDENIKIWNVQKLMSEAEFRNWVSNRAKHHPEKFWKDDKWKLHIDIDPPPLLNSQKEKQLQQLINRLRAHFAPQNIHLFASGFRIDGE